ncbi:hypothetical protein JXQ70_15005 [bacterium]|nr:hypothetical protein [bacterium]
MKKCSFFVLVMLLGLIDGDLRSVCQAEDSGTGPTVITITSEGSAHIVEGKVEQSRLNALRIAYARATFHELENKSDSFVLRDTISSLSEIVARRSHGFVTDYHILQEGISERDDSLYEVSIQAKVVEQGEISPDAPGPLKLYLELLDNPRLLLFISETGAFDPGEDKTSDRDMATVIRGFETVLSHHFTRYGYQVITSDDVLAQDLARPESLAQAKAGVTARAVEIGRLANADLVLVGTLRLAHDSSSVHQVELFSVTAEFSAKAIIVSSGRLIDALHESFQVSHPQKLKAYSDCIDKAGRNVAEYLSWKIPQFVTENTRETILFIEGIGKSQALTTQNVLTKLAGIEQIRIVQLPTEKDASAQYILVTGFVTPAADEIVTLYHQTINQAVTMKEHNKYQLVLEIRK